MLHTSPVVLCIIDSGFSACHFSPSVSEQLGISLQSLSYNMTNMFSFKGTKETEINERIAKQEFSFPFRGDNEYPTSDGHGHHCTVIIKLRARETLKESEINTLPKVKRIVSLGAKARVSSNT